MEIYLGNIPKGTRPSEIRKLVKDSFRGHIFERIYDRMITLGRFEQGMAINIKKRHSRDGGRYGRVRFHSKHMAEFAVELLNGSEIRGEGISVRPYVQRQTDNDRRLTESGNWKGRDRRKKDRRKH